MTDEETRDDQVVEAINGLSNTAHRMLMSDWFGRVVFGKSALFVPRNDEQERAFDELLDVGFAHADVEGGHVGYRSTYYGQGASNLVRTAAASITSHQGGGHE